MKVQLKGYSYVGGVIGCNASGQIIVDAINNGNISGLDSVWGEILGYYYCDDDMLLENTNNSGTITGRTAVGGIVGIGGRRVYVRTSQCRYWMCICQ